MRVGVSSSCNVGRGVRASSFCLTWASAVAPIAGVAEGSTVELPTVRNSTVAPAARRICSRSLIVSF